MKSIIFGLLTLTALGVVSLPAIADEANVQSATQVTTQEGHSNTSVQRTNQNIETYRRKGNAGAQNDSGNVQDIYQDTMQRGVNNYGQQVNNQRIKTQQETRRGNTHIQVNQ